MNGEDSNVLFQLSNSRPKSAAVNEHVSEHLIESPDVR